MFSVARIIILSSIELDFHSYAVKIDAHTVKIHVLAQSFGETLQEHTSHCF